MQHSVIDYTHTRAHLCVDMMTVSSRSETVRNSLLLTDLDAP